MRRPALAALIAAALAAGCALKSPPGKDEMRAEALPNTEDAGRLDGEGQRRRNRRKRLARGVQRSPARSVGARGHRVQPRPAHGSGAHRAGRRLREARGREALPAGQLSRARRRQDERGLERHRRRRDLRKLGDRPLGPRALGARSRLAAVRIRPARCRVCPAVHRCPRRQELVSGDRGAAAEGHRGADSGRRRAPRGLRAGSPARRQRRRI